MSSTRVHRPIRAYTRGLHDRKPGNREIPFGCYKYDSTKNDLPGGLFHFVRDGDLYVPTLHGLTAEYIRTLKDVAVCSANSSMVIEIGVSQHAPYVRGGAHQHGPRAVEARR